MRKLLLAAVSALGLLTATSAVEAHSYRHHGYHHGYGHSPHWRDYRYHPRFYFDYEDYYYRPYWRYEYRPRYYAPRYHSRRHAAVRVHVGHKKVRSKVAYAKPKARSNVAYAKPRSTTRANNAYNNSKRVHLSRAVYGGSPRSNGMGPRPGAWCGWFMRGEMGVRDPSYNLARNWAHWGRPAGGPKVGAVVVWPHHVGKIVGRNGDGRWIVHQGNYNNRVATVPMNLRNVIAYRLPK